MTEIRPDILTLFMSGYADNAIGQEPLGPGSAFLAKPFGPTEMAFKIRALLSGVPEGQTPRP